MIRASWFFLLLFVALNPLYPTADSRRLSNLGKRFKRQNIHVQKRQAESDPHESDTIKILEEAVRNIPLSQFEDDPSLLQTVDRVNSLTLYRTPYKLEGKESDVVYERNGNDKDKDIIVLSSAEDKVSSIKSHAIKQTYVVLRKNPRALSPSYYVSYAYVRNATTKDDGTIKVGDSYRFIEWDIWDDRTVKSTVLWKSCASSVFVSCGFNPTAYADIGVPISSKDLSTLSTGANRGSDDDSNNATKPAVAMDDKEFDIDNADFYDDLNIDLVHGRAVGDGAGTLLGGGSASITCALVGLWGGGCGGVRSKKTIIIKAAPPVYPVNVLPAKGPAPGPPQVYLPLGTPKIPPLPAYLDPSTPQCSAGVFYPDNRQIPPVDGSLVPFGPKKPYLFQATDPNTFGKKLPKEKSTTGLYAPTGSRVSVHGVMTPVKEGQGIFIPDGMAYFTTMTPDKGGAPVKGFHCPGYPGHPDVFVPDSDMVNPLRKIPDQSAPLHSTSKPDQPNPSFQVPKPGLLLMNKMPQLFIPDALNPVKSIFTDDPHKLPQEPGFLIPNLPGLPETFIPDKEQEVKDLKPPPQGMMSPVSPGAKPAEHGLLFPGPPGVEPLFIPDEAGGIFHFTPSQPSYPASDGVLTPANKDTVNDYYPLHTAPPMPPKPAMIPGVMTPVNNTKKQPIPGNLVINKPNPPYPFIPNGVGTKGVLNPEGGKPGPIPGIWVPGWPKGPDEFIPLDDPPCGLPPTKGTFTPDGKPDKIPCETGYPNRPLGNPIIKNAPPQPRPAPNLPPAPEPTTTGRFIPDAPGPEAPMNVVSPKPPVAEVPLQFTPSNSFPPGKNPRGTAEVPGLHPQKGKVIPPTSPGGPATFVPDPAQSIPGTFTPLNPPGSPARPGYIGPPSPPREGEPTTFTPDNNSDAPKENTPGTLTTPGQPPDRGILHPPPKDGGPCPFTPFSPSTFIPDKNPTPIAGSTEPGVTIPSGDPHQEVPFYPDNQQQVPVGAQPQRGKLQRNGAPDCPGVLKAPVGPGKSPIFVPDPINSKPSTLVPDNNPLNPVDGAATLPYSPTDPISFKPDNKMKVPPGDSKGKLLIPGNIPPEQHGTVKNPPDPNSPVLFQPDKPVIFTPATLVGSAPVPGSKEDEKGPGQPVKFYPNDPSQLTQVPTPGTLSAPTDPSFQPVSGLLRPDYPPPAYSFQPFPQGTFTPDSGGPPSPGGVETSPIPGQNPNFYPNNPSAVNPGNTPGKLESGPGAPPQHGILEPSTSPPNGPRPFVPFPAGTFYPDSNPASGVPVSVQSGPTPNDPSQLRGNNPMNPLQPGPGTLKPPGKPDQHGTVSPPSSPGGPSTFTPDPPGSKPANFFPETGGPPVPGIYSDVPTPTFKPNDPGQLQPGPQRGSLAPTQPPGSPLSSGELTPGTGGPGGPWNWKPDPMATWHPTDPPGMPVVGTCPPIKPGQDTTIFYPQVPSQMLPGTPKGTLDMPGSPDQRGTMESNPKKTPQPSWVFKVNKPDSSFVPEINPNSPIQGSTSPAFPGAPIPFYPQNPGGVPPGGPLKGTLNQPNQPPKQGQLLPPSAPGQPHMFQETPPSLFYKDSDPLNPISGNAERPSDPTKSIPFDPIKPGSLPPNEQPPGVLKSSGAPDVHGYMEPAKGPGQKALFHPDPEGSRMATFFPDTSPSSGVDGILSPGEPQTFRPSSDPNKLMTPNAGQHGQMVPKMPPGSPPEFGSVEPPLTPGGPYRWIPDPEGATSAWFHPDADGTKPIRGMYYPPPPGSTAETPANFRPTNPAEAPHQDTHGQMKKENPPNSPPETGTLKTAAPGEANPFMPDPNTGIPAIFYPDMGSTGPVEGTYFPSTQADTPGTFKPKDGDGAVKQLPAPGQMCPTGPNQPQIHGALKAPPTPGMPLFFQPDKHPPEFEIALVPLPGTPDKFEQDKEVTISIRGCYFKTTITTQIFVSYTGSSGMFVTNGVPPTDPKVECASVLLIPKQSAEEGTAQLIQESKHAHCKLQLAQMQTNTPGVFYPSGVTATGFEGTLFVITSTTREYIFKAMSHTQEGTWKSQTKSGCFLFDEAGQLIPFDMEILKKRDEEYNKPQVTIKAFNFQGVAQPDKWNIFIEITGGKGKFRIGNSQTVVHGFLKPEEVATVTKAEFTPDDPTILRSMSQAGPVAGTFEQDESPSAAGIFPNNGIPGSITSTGTGFTMTFNNPGRKGSLTPGKKPQPGFFVYCFGLVQNVKDPKGIDYVANPVSSPGSKGRSFGRSPAKMGRSFPIGVNPSMVTSENMPAKQALNQDFGKYLDSLPANVAEQSSEYITETRTETRTETVEETETKLIMVPVTMGPQVSQAQMEEVKKLGLGNGVPGSESMPAMMPGLIPGSMPGNMDGKLASMMPGVNGGQITYSNHSHYKKVEETEEKTSLKIVKNSVAKPMGRSFGLVAMSPDMRAQLEKYGVRPVTQEETDRILTPEKMAQVQQMMQGRSFPRPGKFLPGSNEVKDGGFGGTAYISTTGSTLFLPDGGSEGILYIQTASALSQIPATFTNSKTDPGTGTIKSDELAKLTEALKTQGHPTSAAFVPTGGFADQGGIQLSDVKVDGDGVSVKVSMPGERGNLQVPKAGEVAESLTGKNAVGVFTGNDTNKANEDKAKSTKLPEGYVHGTYYKVTPKDFFAPDYPGTLGTFYPAANTILSKPVRGCFYPAPIDTAEEMFWAENDDLSAVLPMGKDIILNGKFVPDEVPGNTAGEEVGGMEGRMMAGKFQRSYVFRAHIPGVRGTMSKNNDTAEVKAAAKGRGFIEDRTQINFVADAAVDINDHPGWKTQFEIIVPNVTFKYEAEIFFGYGNCPHLSTLTPAVLRETKTDDDVILFYMGLLRTYCIASARNYIKTLVSEGYLKINNKLLTIPEDCKYLSMPKLTQKETEKLSAAFEMTVFSLTYSDEVKKGITLDSVITSDNKRISRSVKFLLDMSLLGIKMSRELCRLHSVRLTRNIVISLTTALTKLRQDLDALKNCDACKLDKEIINNDALQLMGMVQFVMHGLSSVEPDDHIRTAYEEFYSGHKSIIQKKTRQISFD